MREDFHLIIVE